MWWQAAHQIGGADTFAIAADNDGAVGESTTPMTGSEPSTYVLPSTTTKITLANYCSNDDAGAGSPSGMAEQHPRAVRVAADAAGHDGERHSDGRRACELRDGFGRVLDQLSGGGHELGVRLVQLRVDGEPVAVKDYLASCSYTNFQACPPSVSDTVSWNTATVANGEHRVELVVEDAAQNTSVIYSGEVTIQNSSKTSPLGALPGPGSTGLQTLGIGNANGIRASEKAELQLGLPATITRSYAHRAIVISGRLLDGQGQPIAHASLDVLEQIDGAAAPAVIGHATTGVDGTFRVRVGSGPSRLIDVGYRAFSGDAGYAALGRVRETVAAGVRLRISPTRTGSEGMIVLSGTVEGPIPRQGTIVDLLVHYRGRWEPFRTPRTNGRGRFRVLYQFEGGVGRFPFRAEVPGGQAGFPFGSGESRVVNVSTG